MTDAEAYSVFSEAAARFASREAFNYIGTRDDETVKYAKGTIRIVVKRDERDTRLCMFDMNSENEMFMIIRNDNSKSGRKNDGFIENHDNLEERSIAYAIELSQFVREEIGKMRSKDRNGRNKEHLR